MSQERIVETCHVVASLGNALIRLAYTDKVKGTVKDDMVSVPVGDFTITFPYIPVLDEEERLCLAEHSCEISWGSNTGNESPPGFAIPTDDLDAQTDIIGEVIPADDRSDSPARDTVMKQKRESFDCDRCHEVCYDARDLRRHVRAHHLNVVEKSTRDDTPGIPCDVEGCDRVLLTRSGFLYHKRVHAGVHPFPCQYCDKRFRSKQACQHHTRIHTGETPYSCKKCGRSFRLTTSRNVHEKKCKSQPSPDEVSNPEK